MANTILSDFLSSIQIFVISGLFLDEIKHGLISVFFAYIFYLKTKSLKHAIFIVFLTYLIDSDHLFDYFLYYGFDFSFAKFISLDYFEFTRRAIVPFHAWEWVIFMAAIAWSNNKKDNLLLKATAVGFFSHLVWDMVTVNSFWFYSIIYRISQSFIVI